MKIYILENMRNYFLEYNIYVKYEVLIFCRAEDDGNEREMNNSKLCLYLLRNKYMKRRYINCKDVIYLLLYLIAAVFNSYKCYQYIPRQH